MPNDIANNMADTIHQLEEDRIMLNTQLTDLQLAYNEQMLELKEAKRLLKAAVEDMNNSVNDVHCKYCSKWHTDQCKGTSHLDCYVENKFKWRYAAEALALIGEDTNVPASKDGDTNE